MTSIALWAMRGRTDFEGAGTRHPECQLNVHHLLAVQVRAPTTRNHSRLKLICELVPAYHLCVVNLRRQTLFGPAGRV